MDFKYNNQVGISQRERAIIDTMLGLGRSIIDSGDLQDQFSLSKARSNLMISRLYKKGWLQRLKPGIYKIIPLGSGSADPAPDDPMSIAQTLFGPGYIAGWTAAQHWDLTEQIFNTIVFYTTTRQRATQHQIAGVNFKTKHITPNQLFGTTGNWTQTNRVEISDIHKTVIDILDDPSIGGGGRAMIDIFKSYQHKKEMDMGKLLEYAMRINHGAVFKRLGFIAEKMMEMPESYLDKLKAVRKKGIILLDPYGPIRGPIITKWGIRINIPLTDIS